MCLLFDSLKAQAYVAKLGHCLSDSRDWIAANIRKLNDDETQARVN